MPRYAPLPSLILGTCDVCVNTHKHQRPHSPHSLILSLSLPPVSTVPMQKELALSCTQTRHISPCMRWRDAESTFGIQWQIKPSKLRMTRPLYLTYTSVALSFFPSFYSLAKYTPPSFSISHLSQDRSLMAYTDSNITARLTVDILFSLKTCPAPLFPLLCPDC